MVPPGGVVGGVTNLDCGVSVGRQSHPLAFPHFSDPEKPSNASQKATPTFAPPFNVRRWKFDVFKLKISALPASSCSENKEDWRGGYDYQGLSR